MKRILHLPLHRTWYDMIYSEVKKTEYRAITLHWVTRLFDLKKYKLDAVTVLKSLKESGSKSPYLKFLKEFDLIKMVNGYGHHRPNFLIELQSIEIGSGLEEWGAVKGEIYFCLNLGEII